jgi:serine/threonine protein kinase
MTDLDGEVTLRPDPSPILTRTLYMLASKKNQIIPEEQCLDWFSQITSAVECMHAEGILHRDLKLANCFFLQCDRSVLQCPAILHRGKNELFVRLANATPS